MRESQIELEFTVQNGEHDGFVQAVQTVKATPTKGSVKEANHFFQLRT